jgi:hypothetical protein
LTPNINNGREVLEYGNSLKSNSEKNKLVIERDVGDGT